MFNLPLKGGAPQSFNINLLKFAAATGPAAKSATTGTSAKSAAYATAITSPAAKSTARTAAPNPPAAKSAARTAVSHPSVAEFAAAINHPAAESAGTPDPPAPKSTACAAAPNPSLVRNPSVGSGVSAKHKSSGCHICRKPFVKGTRRNRCNCGKYKHLKCISCT